MQLVTKPFICYFMLIEMKDPISDTAQVCFVICFWKMHNFEYTIYSCIKAILIVGYFIFLYFHFGLHFGAQLLLFITFNAMQNAFEWQQIYIQRTKILHIKERTNDVPRMTDPMNIYTKLRGEKQ